MANTSPKRRRQDRDADATVAAVTPRPGELASEAEKASRLSSVIDLAANEPAAPWFNVERTLEEAAVWLRDHPQARGLLVYTGESPQRGAFVDLISADALARQMADPSFRDSFGSKPLASVLERWPFTATEMAVETSLEQAVEALLKRPAAATNEPVVVRTGPGEHERSLVGAEGILLAQCRLQDRAVRRMRAAERELRRAAAEDPLTGLPNRRGFGRRLQTAIDEHRNDPTRHFGVLYMDFDRFKWVNDSLGHEAGDELLASIAARITRVLRDGDAVSRLSADACGDASGLAARVGGDEFLVLLDNLADPLCATAVADRLLRALAEPHRIRNHEIRSTASIGITSSARDYGDASAVLRDADLAMYRAKLDGGGRYVLFDEEMHEEALFRLTAEGLLRTAAGRNELEVQYQPIVNLADGQVRGHEALLRWHSRELGSVSPARFIPLAEEAGLIVGIGRWMLNRALRDVATWRGHGADLTVSVNLSPRQLNDERLPDEVARLLALHEVPADRLCLEVTETGLMRDRSRGAALLRRLRETGVRIVLDDFGTGYSSLACLQQLPLDGVKLRPQLHQPAHRGCATGRHREGDGHARRRFRL